ncbi:hypothetical protein ACFYYH_03365 [Streptomyces sp. NPDC002018]|uniref:hypothetical protein n=1 Tax=Streptomyces sp. NPDC002018 TaxID=3364629 RepID=UPI00368A3DC4
MLYELFSSGPDEGLGRLMHAARQAHYTLPFLVLSVIEREGVAMGPAATGELARARRRSAHYRDVLGRLAADAEFTVLKGPSLASAYPSGVFRPQGDIDLLVPDEEQLWRIVGDLSDPAPAAVWVTVLGQERHLLVTLVWPPEEPLLDPEYRVELSTAALLGNAEVPIRVHPPEDPWLSNLVCLAEERLQRAFHPRDALDLYMLTGQGVPALADLVRTVVDFRLAPEVAELVRYTAAFLPVDGLTGMLPALDGKADAERERRRAESVPPTSATTAESLGSGAPLHGIRLGRVPSSVAMSRARIHRYGDEALLLTPVGAYLLVGEALVSPERYEAAHTELAGLLVSADADATRS